MENPEKPRVTIVLPHNSASQKIVGKIDGLFVQEIARIGMDAQTSTAYEETACFLRSELAYIYRKDRALRRAVDLLRNESLI